MKTKVLLSVLLSVGALAQAETVTVYSARNEQLIKPLFDAYTRETGVQVRFVTGTEGALLARLKAEGANSPADMLLTVDAGNLWLAANQGVLKPVKSAVLESNIPAHLRDPNGEWFGLSVRARTMFYNKVRVQPASLSSYEDLADPKWKGRLCLRTSKKVYNQSLVAMLIAQHGEQKTEQIVRGWVANLATAPFSDDTAMLKAVAAGQCEVGIANTYYYGRMIAKEPNLPVGIFWANQKAGGVHVNVSGAGVTRHARNEKGAIRLIEWLSSNKAQNLYADKNMEYPANPKIKADSIVAGWGSFKPNLINVAKAGELQAQATKLMDRAGYK
ncbi:iron(III) transport system substrate-binding protein [Formivibrio citricus]|uniref:Iron(III) transport system substrate-binding protein n=1 Tax=Formivibrio citricus TaxID=83765 RepID=A0A1I5CPT0_9NEIS|nr:Fe(3+) ABC transporter substrate-binding protein [Formivibrio citricus]SFN88933.1 iron(III) transport system substrate-binding protein [Formivibrio citricus]